MKNYDESVEVNRSSNWSYIPDNSYRILIISSSESGKTNVLLYFTKHQRPDIEKNLFVRQKSIRIKILITYQWKIQSSH